MSASDLRPGDVVRLEANDELYMVVSVHYGHDEHTELEPLGSVLARHLVVSDRGEPVPLGDALEAAGWLRPGADHSARELLADGMARGESESIRSWCRLTLLTLEGGLL